jgi:hypothetical protein
MTLNISKALADFDLADYCDIDCGKFDIRIRQAAIHNEDFRAAVSKRAMAAKRKSLVPDRGAMTGSYKEDVKLFLDLIIQGWGDHPMKDDNGKDVVWTKEFGYEMFTTLQAGRVLFGKIMKAATEDEMFMIAPDDMGN